MTIANYTVNLQNIDWVNLGCLIWFFTCWIGYARFARHMAKKSHCIASTMHSLRLSWMEAMLKREQRIADASIVSNLEKNVAFMASTSILVLAGIVTALTSADQVSDMLSSMHISADNSTELVQFKLLLLAFIFIYAFFTFTWSLRQFGFSGVMIGASPLFSKDADQSEYEVLVRHGAKIIDQASHSYNFGLRAYYFSMAALSWFIHPIFFVISVAIVVWILYQREFQSNTMKALLQVNQDLKQLNKK